MLYKESDLYQGLCISLVPFVRVGPTSFEVSMLSLNWLRGLLVAGPSGQLTWAHQKTTVFGELSRPLTVLHQSLWEFTDLQRYTDSI